MSSSRSKDAIVAALEDHKQQLQDAMGRLQTAAQMQMDPRHHLARRPWATVGVGLSIGLILGLMGSSD